jgi:NAD(P)-dependent dehydrogenase (short-subunit alcohol dehydrogenase family)
VSDAPPGRFTRGPLDQRCALVTGASRGLGRAVALALAEAGADVVVLGRSRHELDVLAAEIESLTRSAHILVCDLTDGSQLARALDAAPTPDILVNNAGTNRPEPFLEVAEPTFDRLLALNVRGLFFCAQHTARRMINEEVEGSIVNVSSQLGHVGARNRSVYCATKHAVEGLTKALALELAPHGIRVNSVAPTYLQTPMAQPFLSDPAVRAELLARIPLARFGTVSEVAAAITFLASDASSLITGASLVVDGGYTAQ